MLLTITTTRPPASDLGYILHKHPGKVQAFDLSFGRAHVYYPEVSEERCTAALLLEIDPISLVRAFRGSGGARLLEHYVNDRPYVASSFFSVAIGRVYRSALAGQCKDRPDLVETPIPLEATLAVVPVRGGPQLLERLFAPLGYTVRAERHALDPDRPEWGDSIYYTVTLSATTRVAELLNHLYVLIPVLDQEKHYWVGDDEIEKLLKHGAAWLPEHPEKEMIALRYLKQRRSLARAALERMAESDDLTSEETAVNTPSGEDALEQRLSLNERRIQTVVEVLKEHSVARVVDLGCGEGKLLRALLQEKSFAEILGMDVSARTLEFAEDKLRFDRMPEKQRARIRLIQGSLTYRDNRLAGYDAATLIEVIEHVDLDRLDALERVVFRHAKPGLVVVTTPNIEYNAKFENMKPGQMRHSDHRFEWTRGQFTMWATRVADEFGYAVTFRAIGDEDPTLGAPTQMAVFVQK